MIAVTDRAVVVLEAKRNGTIPTKVLARLPRETRIDATKGAFMPLRLDGEKMWIHKRFKKDVEAANQRIPA
jgi:hypothetical protein